MHVGTWYSMQAKKERRNWSRGVEQKRRRRRRFRGKVRHRDPVWRKWGPRVNSASSSSPLMRCICMQWMKEGKPTKTKGSVSQQRKLWFFLKKTRCQEIIKKSFLDRHFPPSPSDLNRFCSNIFLPPPPTMIAFGKCCFFFVVGGRGKDIISRIKENCCLLKKLRLGNDDEVCYFSL